MDNPTIAPDFPFESQYIDIHGSTMHYIDEGEGDPVLFLHGNPTSSYLWRNIIPYLSDRARCIAPDLIGMGKSDKPDIPYRFNDHYRYVSRFIEALDLQNITFVIHDWGSALGFHYAMQHESNVKGIAFMESITRPMAWSRFSGAFRLLFGMFRSPLIGELINGRLNFFVTQVMVQSIIRELSEEEKRAYAEPYPTYASRRAVWQWPREIPIDGKPDHTYAVVDAYWRKLQESELPKLLLHAKPGALIPAAEVEALREALPNLTVEAIGAGIHYVQEDNPHAIGEAIQRWYTSLG